MRRKKFRIPNMDMTAAQKVIDRAEARGWFSNPLAAPAPFLYDQVKSYIEANEPLAVSTCYCRHQARLIDEEGHCGAPDEVCLQFGSGAAFVIEKGMGRQIHKQEALQILNQDDRKTPNTCSLPRCTGGRGSSTRR